MSTKRKFPSKLGQPAVKPSAKPTTKENLNDSKAVVSSGVGGDKAETNGNGDVVEISSDSGSAEDEDEDEDEETSEEPAQLVKASAGEDVDMEDADHTAEKPEETEEQGEPSFGDLVLANTTETIDVAGAFNDPALQTLSYPQSNKLQPPSGASLGTVLTQALKTNDLSLLESCLQTPDISTIRATIQRLDSPLAGTLLQKIAERLHRRPGRAGSLMVWVQWTLVTHGGYLATQPDLIKKLAELNRVIDERARGLQSLLSLKGKLDMLEAQMQLRQSMRQQRRELDEEDDEGVIYVEGQEESDSDSETEPAELANGKAKAGRAVVNGDLSGDESEESESMPTTANGVIADSDDESEVDNLIDDEAEETDAESEDEDEVDHSDVDELDEEEESDDAAPARSAPPTKMQKVDGLFSKRRN